MTYGGTDPGLCTMSTTVGITEQHYNMRIKLFNRYSPLATPEENEDDDCVMDMIPKEEESEPELPEMPKALRNTAGELDQQTLCRKHRMNREKRKVGDPLNIRRLAMY